MQFDRIRARPVVILCALAVVGLAGCAPRAGGPTTGRDAGSIRDAVRAEQARIPTLTDEEARRRVGRSSLLDLFTNADPPNTTIEVNKYIWNAAQEVLDFLPVDSVDPFSGVLVYGYGTPPGGGTPYRATVYVQDPALDARSLNIALATRDGPATAATVRAVEDAILTRARQLRIRDAGF